MDTGLEEKEQLVKIVHKERGERLRRLRGFIDSNGFLICVVIIGLSLRVASYLHNRPFWTDEAQLALNIRAKSLVELLGQLDYCQAAPPGFLVLEKALILSLGESELVLRLLPLAAGLCSLSLFVLFAKKVLQGRAIVLSVLLFAMSESLIRYSSELKQYSSDVFFALLLWLAGFGVIAKRSGRIGLVLAALLGVVAPWFSYASILCGAGILLTGLWAEVVAKHWRRAVAWACFAGVFSVNVAFVCLVSLRGVACGPCKDALMDARAVPPHGLGSVNWFVHKVFEVMQVPGGFSELAVGVALLCLSVGCWQMMRQRWVVAWSLWLPVMLALIASWWSLYPFFGRFLLFAVPAVLLFVAQGAQWLCGRMCNDRVWVSAGIVALLVLPRLDLLHWDGNHVGFRHTDVKGALNHIKEQKQKGDLIYVYYGAYFPTLYYCRSIGIDEKELVIGVPGYWWNSNLRNTLLGAWEKTSGGLEKPDEVVFESYKAGDFSKQWRVFDADVKRLCGHRRVWVLFSLTNWLGSDEEKLFLYFLDQHGSRLRSYGTSGASVYLYDLTSKGGQQKSAL